MSNTSDTVPTPTSKQYVNMPREGGEMVLLVGQFCRAGIDLETNTSQEQVCCLGGFPETTWSWGYWVGYCGVYRPLWCGCYGDGNSVEEHLSDGSWSLGINYIKLLPCRGLENLRFCGVPPPDFDEGCTVSVEDFVDVGSSLSFRSCTRMSAWLHVFEQRRWP